MSNDDGTTRPDGSSQPAPEHEWPTSDSGPETPTTDATPTERISTADQWGAPATSPYGQPASPYGQPTGEAPSAPQFGQPQGSGDSTSAAGGAAGAQSLYAGQQPSGAPSGYPGSGQVPGSPASGYGQEGQGYGQSGYGQQGQPGQGYGQPQPDANPSQPGYSQSQPGYSQPQPGYVPPQPGYAPPQPGYPAPGGGYGAPSGGYGTPGGYPPPGAGYAPYPGPGGSSAWDGPSIAAFVTALLGLAIVPVILGVIGNKRTQRNGTQGRWMAIVGLVLGALQVLSYITLAVVLTLAISHDRAEERAELDALHAGCAAGSMSDCDDLYWAADIDSDEEEFAETCGGITTDSGGICYLQDEDSGTGTDDDASTSSGEPQHYGDDAELDALWDACEAGDGAACDSLYIDSPFGSDYEEFGETCGNRLDDAFLCAGNI